MPSHLPRIAVLLAAYNGLRWLEAQLDSIQGQKGVTVDVFLSDDFSTDGTSEWCSDYARRHHNVTLLPPVSRCGGAAGNFFHLIRSVDFTPFDFVALADQDDLWHLDKLLRACTAIAAHHAAAYSSNVLAFWPDGRTLLLDKAQAQVRWDHCFEAAGPGCTYVLSNCLAVEVQNAVTQQWQEVQQVTLHDWYIYSFARHHDFKWFIDPLPGMDYRQHINNQLGANVGWRALLSRYRAIRGGWWFAQVALIARLTRQPNSRPPRWKNLHRSDLVTLAVKAQQCRRRQRDQWLFRGMCILTAIIGVRSK
jgi:rhamnosyltransferase